MTTHAHIAHTSQAFTKYSILEVYDWLRFNGLLQNICMKAKTSPFNRVAWVLAGMIGCLIKA